MFESMGLAASVGELFAGMSAIVFFFIIIGIMLVVIEFYQPTKGLFALVGALLIGSGIVIRMLGGGTWSMLFLMIFFVAVCILTAHIIMLFFQKSNWLYQSLRLAMKGSTETVEEYEFLVGQIGIATSDISGEGNIAINDVNFHVYSDIVIFKGAKVYVTEVSLDKISVAIYEGELGVNERIKYTNPSQSSLSQTGDGLRNLPNASIGIAYSGTTLHYSPTNSQEDNTDSK